MKKIMMTLAAGRWVLTIAFCCAMATTVFTACGSDDEETTVKDGQTLEQDVPTQIRFTINFDATPDMLKFFDFKISYNDGTGAKQETDTVTKWTKTFTAKLPVVFTFNRQIRVKPDMYDTMIQTQSITYTLHHNYSYELLDATGKVLKSYNANLPTDTKHASGEKLAQRANQGAYDKAYAYDFDASGNMRSAE